LAGDPTENPTDNDIPQTKPTSANEANLENLMKTMFEHEQHDAWLLGRTNLAIPQGALIKRTREADQNALLPVDRFHETNRIGA
jgi:hypothetical protein